MIPRRLFTILHATLFCIQFSSRLSAQDTISETTPSLATPTPTVTPTPSQAESVTTSPPPVSASDRPAETPSPTPKTPSNKRKPTVSKYVTLFSLCEKCGGYYHPNAAKTQGTVGFTSAEYVNEANTNTVGPVDESENGSGFNLYGGAITNLSPVALSAFVGFGSALTNVDSSNSFLGTSEIYENHRKDLILSAQFTHTVSTRVDLGIGAEYANLKRSIVYADRTQENHYSYPEAALLAGYHDPKIEASLKLTPGKTIKAKSDVTTTTETSNDLEIPTSLDFRGRTLMSKRLFGGGGLLLAKSPSTSELGLSVEVGTVAKTLQTSGRLAISQTKKKDLARDVSSAGGRYILAAETSKAMGSAHRLSGTVFLTIGGNKGDEISSKYRNLGLSGSYGYKF